jgi:membrane glycosyltransferase
MLLMIFAPKIATGLDVLLRRSSREAYGGAACFILNVAGETVFSFLLSPVMAFAHTVFLFRLFILGRGYAWNSQMRESHVVPWSVAWAKLWPQTLIGFAVIAIIAMKAPGDVVYALAIAGGFALSVPFAVASASPVIGALFARIGVGRIPEEVDPPDALLPLRLPALEVDALGKRQNGGRTPSQ